MGDIGAERAHYDVLSTAEDVPAPVVEVWVGGDDQQVTRQLSQPTVELGAASSR